MRLARAKRYRKTLRYFSIVHSIVEPYKVLLDGNFIHACLSQKFNVESRISSVLQKTRVILFVPSKALDELLALGPDFKESYSFASKYCNILKKYSNDKESASDQIKAIVGEDNSDKYFIATQDITLRGTLHRIQGCPLLFISRSVLIMEKPAGMADRLNTLSSVPSATTEEKKIVKKLSRKMNASEKAKGSLVKKKVKRRAKAPNPLSCKRKKNFAKKKEKRGMLAVLKSSGANGS